MVLATNRVTLTIREPGMPEMEAAGRLSPDRRTLTITRFGGTGKLRGTTNKVNWVFRKE